MADHYTQLGSGGGGGGGGPGGYPPKLLHGSGGVAAGDKGGIKEQDRLLPIANVGRIMKKVLPPNAKVSKEAKETMQECVSEFISFVTGEGSHKCHKEKRKTVNGDDICWAFSALGFDDYVDPMRRYLLKFRQLEGNRAAVAASLRGGRSGLLPDASTSGTSAGGSGNFMFDAVTGAITPAPAGSFELILPSGTHLLD